MWGFPKIGVPPYHPFQWDSPLQTNHFGDPPFMENPIYTIIDITRYSIDRLWQLCSLVRTWNGDASTSNKEQLISFRNTGYDKRHGMNEKNNIDLRQRSASATKFNYTAKNGIHQRNLNQQNIGWSTYCILSRLGRWKSCSQEHCWAFSWILYSSAIGQWIWVACSWIFIVDFPYLGCLTLHSSRVHSILEHRSNRE